MWLALGLGLVVSAMHPSRRSAAGLTDGAVAPKPGLEGWIEGVVGEPVVGGKIAVAGWAADRQTGTPVNRVEVLLDGSPVAVATVNVARPDVAKVTGRPDWDKAGWTAIVDLQGVSPGRHTISAIAAGRQGRKQSLHGDKRIEVRASPAPAPTAGS
jgi:hypothetical protein